MTGRRLPAPSGFWAFWWSLLASPTTTWALLLALGAAAVLGLASSPGAHPATTPLAVLPAALLPFNIVARHLGAPWRVVAPRAAWAAGLALAVGGTLLAGGGAGEARLRPGERVESYDRWIAGRRTPHHLGGQLVVAVEGDRALLRLGVAEHQIAVAELPLTGDGEVRIGPWAVALRAIEPGDTPTRVRLRARPRAGGEPIERIVPAGGAVELADGARVSALRLSADYGRTLGAAAQLQVEWPGGREAAWYFVDAPGLDERVGTAPWIIEPLEVLADPVLVLDVRRAGHPGVAVAGWVLMAAALLALAFDPSARPAGEGVA